MSSPLAVGVIYTLGLMGSVVAILLLLLDWWRQEVRLRQGMSEQDVQEALYGRGWML